MLFRSILANAAFTSGNSQVTGTLRSAAVAVGVGVATGVDEPHAVKNANEAAMTKRDFIVISMRD